MTLTLYRIFVIVLTHGRRHIYHHEIFFGEFFYDCFGKVPTRLVTVKAEYCRFYGRMMCKEIVNRLVIQATQRQIMCTAPRHIVLILAQSRTGHGINRRFINLHGIALRVFGGNQKAVLLFTAGNIATESALTTSLERAARHAMLILAYENAVAIVAARGLVQDAAAHAVAQDLRADATVHQVSSNGFGVSIRGRKCKWTRLVRLYRRCLSRLKRNSDRCHLVQQTNR